MTERIKLENPGDELTLTVASVSPEEIGGYAYWKISDGVKEFVAPQKSLNPQVERLGVATAPEMVGKTVRFSRSTKLSSHGKPYWNVDGVKHNGAPKPSHNSHASKPEAELPEYLRDAEAQDSAELAGKVGFDIRGIQNTLSLYQSVYEWYVATIVPIATKADIGASPESVNAGVATIMIQAKK